MTYAWAIKPAFRPNVGIHFGPRLRRGAQRVFNYMEHRTLIRNNHFTYIKQIAALRLPAGKAGLQLQTK